MWVAYDVVVVVNNNSQKNNLADSEAAKVRRTVFYVW